MTYTLVYYLPSSLVTKLKVLTYDEYRFGISLGAYYKQLLVPVFNCENTYMIAQLTTLSRSVGCYRESLIRQYTVGVQVPSLRTVDLLVM